MNYFDYAIIGIYLFLLIFMGYKLRGQSSKNDYFLGGRSVGWKPLTLSVMATQLSAISFVSAPAFVGMREGGGMQWLSYELAVPLAMILILSTVLPVLYRSGVVSIYDYLEQRFGRSSRLIISVVFQFSRAFATGIMIYAVSLILIATMGITLWQSIVIVGVITVLYSLQGGMKAVVYGDAIQMVIIVLGTVACAYFGLSYLGGFNALVENVDHSRLQAINFSSFGIEGDGFGFLPMVFGGIVLYASYYGCDQTQTQRALSAKDTTQLKKMMMANGLLRFPITLLYCFSGIVIGTFALTDANFSALIPDGKSDMMMPVFIINYLPHGIIGMLIVAILSAAMSSLSSTINSLAAVSVEDYCRITGKEPDDQKYMQYAKYTSVFWGAVTLTLSLYAGDIAATVIEAINKVGSLFYGPILAIFLLAVFDKRLSAKQINIGLLTGVAINFYLWIGVKDLFWFWWNFIGLVTTVITAYAVLLVTKESRLPYSPPTELTDSGEAILTRKDIAILVGYFGLMLAICLSIPSLFN
ncbi:sodium:solute symporter [Psychrobium sp. MM17-31]|uniref:sodium:solute symporter n=1 Tax=Psychrobium sp. MM17-31 TaxID=2917758 RepID=UPI001EF6A342|nr:sodium:solute symporter [Psychrobium sp. MM17-31]MCG7532129.1 sodium:solute symporter [Psychrobium sp. MM17-31]